MNNIPTGHLIGWGVMAFFGIWWLGWLFTRGMAAARKAKALRTEDPAEAAAGLTIGDKEENRADFIRELSKPSPPAPGSPMETAQACATLGVTLAGSGMAWTVLFSSHPIASVAMIAGLVLFLLGGAVAIGSGKS